ncbi:MAG: MBL fold metallo-hydrolase [Bacillota bacterium]
MRNRIKLLLGVILAIITVAAVIFTISRLQPAQAASKPIDIAEIKEVDGMLQICEGVFAVYDDSYKVNVALIVSGKEAAIVDTGYAERNIECVKEYIDNNSLKLKSIFITHHHFDHIEKLSYFKTDDTEVYDYKNTENGQIIKLGKNKLKIVDTFGHNKDQHISIEIMDKHILIAGDVLSSNEPPIISAGKWLDVYKSTLNMIKGDDYALIIPGHGHIEEPEAMVNKQLEYLDNLEKKITEMLKNNADKKEVLSITFEDCMPNMEKLDMDQCTVIHKNNLNVLYKYFVLQKSNS